MPVARGFRKKSGSEKGLLKCRKTSRRARARPASKTSPEGGPPGRMCPLRGPSPGIAGRCEENRRAAFTTASGPAALFSLLPIRTPKRRKAPLKAPRAARRPPCERSERRNPIEQQREKGKNSEILLRLSERGK